MAESSSRNMICPKCNKFQEKSEACKFCGVVIAKVTSEHTVTEKKPVRSGPGNAISSTPLRSGSSRQKMFATIIVIIGVTAGSIFMDPFGPTYAEQLRAELNELPAFKTITKYDPETFNQLEQLINNAEKNKWTFTQVTTRVQKIFYKEFKKFVPSTSDDAINDFVKYFIRVNETLLETNPDLCYGWLTGDPNTALKLSRTIDESTQMEALDRIAEIVRASAEEPQPPPDKEKSEELVQQIGERLYEKYGQEILILNNPGLAAANKRKFCAIAIDLYEIVLARSKRQSSKILRYIFVQT